MQYHSLEDEKEKCTFCLVHQTNQVCMRVSCAPYQSCAGSKNNDELITAQLSTLLLLVADGCSRCLDGLLLPGLSFVYMMFLLLYLGIFMEATIVWDFFLLKKNFTIFTFSG